MEKNRTRPWNEAERRHYKHYMKKRFEARLKRAIGKVLERLAKTRIKYTVTKEGPIKVQVKFDNYDNDIDQIAEFEELLDICGIFVKWEKGHVMLLDSSLHLDKIQWGATEMEPPENCLFYLLVYLNSTSKVIFNSYP